MADYRAIRKGLIRSKKVNRLSWPAECLFSRLLLVADDHGYYYADPQILKADLFPLKDNVNKLDVGKWLDECSTAGLVRRYFVEEEEYLQILNYGQRLHSKPKYPVPSENDKKTNSAANRREPPRTAESRGDPPLIGDDRIGNDMMLIGEETPLAQQQDLDNEFKNRYEKLYPWFKNASNWKHEQLDREIKKFITKYPELPLNQSGALINSWIANYKEKPATGYKKVDTNDRYGQ